MKFTRLSAKEIDKAENVLKDGINKFRIQTFAPYDTSEQEWEKERNIGILLFGITLVSIIVMIVALLLRVDLYANHLWKGIMIAVCVADAIYALFSMIWGCRSNVKREEELYCSKATQYRWVDKEGNEQIFRTKWPGYRGDKLNEKHIEELVRSNSINICIDSELMKLYKELPRLNEAVRMSNILGKRIKKYDPDKKELRIVVNKEPTSLAWSFDSPGDNCFIAYCIRIQSGRVIDNDVFRMKKEDVVYLTKDLYKKVFASKKDLDFTFLEKELADWSERLHKVVIKSIAVDTEMVTWVCEKVESFKTKDQNRCD